MRLLRGSLVIATAAAAMTAALLTAGDAAATSVLATSVAKMAEVSDVVVMGRVSAKSARWDEAGHNIYTYVTLRVDSRFKGEVGEEIMVLVPGGAVGDTRRVVHGAPAFELHEKVIVFLERRTKGDAGFNVVGMFLGKLTVKPVPTGEIVDYGFPAPEVLPEDPPDVVRKKTFLTDFARRMDLRTFVTKVRGDVATAAAKAGTVR